MKPSLELKISQQLTMTPQLQQAIKLLQLSMLDLHTEIQKNLESNPLLETEEEFTNLEQEKTSNQTNQKSQQEQSQVNEPFKVTSNIQSNNSNQTVDTNFENIKNPEITLRDHLLWQMQLTPFSEEDLLIATTIIDAIDDNGFLECDLNDLYETTIKDHDIDFTEVEAVLHRIQQFDPLGVGARNLRECLKIQLEHLPIDSPWREKSLELINNHIELLAKRDHASLKRKLNVSQDELNKIMECIRALNPRPGSNINTRTPEYVVPDIFVRKINGDWQVELNPECTPKLRINNNYAQLMKQAQSSADHKYIRNNLIEAKWFLKSLENRNETLLKVAKTIIHEQKEFLERGEEAMKPLILHDVAEKINMHESTISRVTTNKFMHTPRGTFELKYFFSSHLSTKEGGECSSVAIRALIKKFIAHEDKNHPLSDNKLSVLLKEKGIKVARRTIAKYREAIRIPPSNERKVLVKSIIKGKDNAS